MERKVKPSAGVRQVICKLIAEGPKPPEKLGVVEESPDLIRRRVELRLTSSEYMHIAALAELSGNSANAWVVNLIRANLTRMPQLGMQELQILGESNSRLMAVGRNLNQIARWMNSNQGSGAPEIERIEALSKAIVEHTAYVTCVMRANIDRWVIK